MIGLQEGAVPPYPFQKTRKNVLPEVPKLRELLAIDLKQMDL
jgi:hypothetical protein